MIAFFMSTTPGGKAALVRADQIAVLIEDPIPEQTEIRFSGGGAIVVVGTVARVVELMRAAEREYARMDGPRA